MLQMISILRQVLVFAWSVIAITYVAPAISASTNSHSKAHIEYTWSPATVVVSFREIFPEFADQDPTPLLRIYGDGRVVVFHPSYMKQAGQYEMMMTRKELDDLLYQLTPALMNFDPKDVKKKKKEADDLLLASASDWKDVTLFHDSDAEISVFQVNVDSYQPNGKSGQKILKPNLEKSWRGLRFDARDYIGIEPIQELMRAESALRAISRRSELVRVE